MCPPGPSGPVLPPTAGTTLTQLEMFQKPLKVLGRTLGHTPLGVFCWLEVIDFDPFLGFLLLAPHADFLRKMTYGCQDKFEMRSNRHQHLSSVCDI